MRMAPLALVAITVVARPVAAPDSTGLTQCRAWQESQSVAAKLSAMGPPPTRIRIMGARYLDLLRAEAGLKKTNLLGVGLDNGQWTLTTDDVGVYIILPWLAHELGLPIKSAYDLLFSFLIVACFVSGTLGFVTLTPARRPRLVGVAALAVVSLLAFRVGDVYILLGMLPVALVPWILVGVRSGTSLSLLIVGAISGAAAATSDFVRAGSGTILLVFLTLALVLGKSVRPKVKLAGAAATVVCFAIVWGAFMHLVAQRDAFLLAQTSDESLLRFRHPFWHSAYIGLGYAKNDLVPAYWDGIGVARVCSERPSADYLSQDYESVLRNATEQLVWHHPEIIVRNLAKKTLVVALIVLLCGNIGWLAFLRRPIVWPIDLAFFAAMAANSLYGLLVVPYVTYLFGLISYSALFGATSVMLQSENAEARSPS